MKGRTERTDSTKKKIAPPPLPAKINGNGALPHDAGIDQEALLRALDAMKSNGATVVIISHKPSIFRAADKMLVLREGRVELFGPRDQVMNRLMKPTEVRAVEAGR